MALDIEALLKDKKKLLLVGGGSIGLAVLGWIWVKNQQQGQTAAPAGSTSTSGASDGSQSSDSTGDFSAGTFGDNSGGSSSGASSGQGNTPPGGGSSSSGGSSAPPAGGGTRTYIVKSGDTLSAIAVSDHTTWQNLYSMNKSIIDATAARYGHTTNQFDWIYAGEALQIPA